MTTSAPTAARAEFCRSDAPGLDLGCFRQALTALDLARAQFVSRAQWVAPIAAAFRTFTRAILSA